MYTHLTLYMGGLGTIYICVFHAPVYYPYSIAINDHTALVVSVADVHTFVLRAYAGDRNYVLSHTQACSQFLES